MSASSKKKLRKELEAAALTEKQLKEKADAKKLKIQSIAFIAAMALIVCIALVTIVSTNVAKTGIFQKKTVAVTINDHQLSNVDLNYYYVDALNKSYSDWYSSYGDSTVSLLQMLGLDMTAPLSSQTYNAETGESWADYYISEAIENARGIYALYDAAIAAGFEMSEEERAVLDDNTAIFQDYADLFTGGDVDLYLENLYGTGADLESYKAYVDVVGTANAYQTQYYNALSYDDAAVRAYEAAHYNDYTGYTFAYKFISYSNFLHDGTEGEDHDESTHTDEEIQAALAESKLVAESLLSATSVTEFDQMISALEIYATEESEDRVVSAKAEDALLPSILTNFREWISAEERESGDTTVVPYTSEVTNEDGSTSTTTEGYFAVFYESKNENLNHLANVRHLLVKFEGGSTDANGNTVYSDEEKNAAKLEAEALLKEWNEGAKTEESFIALVQEHSDDSSAAEGGLFEDITPVSNYVPNFLNWSIDPQREVGDAEVIESEYGFHVMYYVGDSEMTYRDYMIRNDLKTNDYNAWLEALEEVVTVEVGNTKYMYRDYIMYSAY